MYRLRLICTSLSLLGALAWSTSASAAILTFDAFLDGLQEVPPSATPASGFGQATLDDASGLFTVTTGTYSGLLASTTAAHLHQAAPGVAGGVILGLSTSGGTSGTFSGSGTLSAAQVAAVIAGNTYFNVHTSLFPGGEIRGQLSLVPEPSSLVLACLGGLGILAMAWRRS